ncbi:MAG: alpha-glucosidase [Culicoidibacterales bacterium]
MELLRANNQIKLEKKAGETNIIYNGRTIFTDRQNAAMLFIGHGEEEIDMYRGNYQIEDNINERTPLYLQNTEAQADHWLLHYSRKGSVQTAFTLKICLGETGLLVVVPTIKETGINRFWLRVVATKEEKIYGCGEQPSYFNLRGKSFPLWTSEPGVGRNKKTMTTWLADVKDKAGGDYYTTYYPEQTFVSTKKYFVHVASFAYAEFNFKNETYHELQVWEIPEKIIFGSAENYIDLLEVLTDFVGRAPALPDWVFEGVIVGVQGGTERVESVTETLRANNVAVAGVFIQDWEGIRVTSFGKRLFWDWKWSSTIYPKLDTKIFAWKAKGLRVMSYINPYVCNDGTLYAHAAEHGYLAKNGSGGIYLVDFGEFDCGIVDFTNPQAFEWFKEIIKVNMIDFGFDGWMADFGEYLPTDVVLHDGSDPMIMHNKWPLLWAKVNYEAIQERGKLGEIVYFMRAGTSGSQKYCTLMWAGDQSVMWEYDDGLASVIPSILSTGMTGCAFNHSDIGGYTSLHNNTRSKELFLRWAEMATFAPFMRTHEGNRPTENFQIYNDVDAMQHFALFTNMFKSLTAYTKQLVEEAATKGTPVNRPIFMHYEDDQEAYDLKYQFMFGPDILVAPVCDQSVEVWEAYLPEDNWIHLWSGTEYRGGKHIVSAPIGEPPVFYRKDSDVAKILVKYQK